MHQYGKAVHNNIQINLRKYAKRIPFSGMFSDRSPRSRSRFCMVYSYSHHGAPLLEYALPIHVSWASIVLEINMISMQAT
jgi:hypothetical protein